MNSKFENLSLKEELLTNLVDLKFLQMTPIQEQALPLVLAGKDLIAQAKTGSGKTAAFGLGILNTIDISHLSPQALILCPTRELAEQVALDLRTLARRQKNVKVLTLCGGTAEYHQEKSLRHGLHIIVGTPGRILRLLKKNTLNLKSVQQFVLDEADRMLDMGFNEDIMNISSYLPKVRQTLLFSATYPDEIQELSKKLQRDAIDIKIDVDHTDNNISQLFYAVEKHRDKNIALLKILAHFRPERSIIFCKTKQIANDVAKHLNKLNLYAEAIHGDLTQNERTLVLTKFSNRSLSILVATDVAARGLDIQGLNAVINYDLPTDPEIYIHRIGRTGRAGNTGSAYSLFLNERSDIIEAISNKFNQECIIEDLALLASDSKYDCIPPMRTLYIGGGKKNKLRPGDLLGALVGLAEMEASDVGDITILNIISYVAIKKEVIINAADKLNNGKIKNRKFKVGLV